MGIVRCEERIEDAEMTENNGLDFQELNLKSRDKNIVPFNLYNAIQKLDKGAKHITKVGDWGIKSFLKKP